MLKPSLGMVMVLVGVVGLVVIGQQHRTLMGKYVLLLCFQLSQLAKLLRVRSLMLLWPLQEPAQSNLALLLFPLDRHPLVRVREDRWIQVLLMGKEV